MLVGMDVPVWVDDDCGVQDAEVLEGYSNSTSSAFTALLDDSEEAVEALEAFMSATVDLAPASPPQPCRSLPRSGPPSPESLWARVDRRCRGAVCRERDRVRDLEGLVRYFGQGGGVTEWLAAEDGMLDAAPVVMDTSPGADRILVLSVPSPFHRLIVHGVCQFYSLSTTTKGTTMFATASVRTLAAVGVSLSSHLATLGLDGLE